MSPYFEMLNTMCIVGARAPGPPANAPSVVTSRFLSVAFIRGLVRWKQRETETAQFL